MRADQEQAFGVAHVLERHLEMGRLAGITRDSSNDMEASGALIAVDQIAGKGPGQIFVFRQGDIGVPCVLLEQGFAAQPYVGMTRADQRSMTPWHPPNQHWSDDLAQEKPDDIRVRRVQS